MLNQEIIGASIKIGELAEFARALISTGEEFTVIIYGPSGIGKTSIISAVCRELNKTVVQTRLGLYLSPAEFRLPFPDKTEREFQFKLSPEFPKEDGTIWILDEVTQAEPPVTAAIQQMLESNRSLGGTTLPRNVGVFLISNTADDGAVLYKLSPPVNNRILHITVTPDFTPEYTTGVLMKMGIPGQMTAYFHTHPEEIYDNTLSLENPTWPSIRSWTEAGKLIRNLDPEFKGLYKTITEAAVGIPAARKFHLWMESTAGIDINPPEIFELGYKSTQTVENTPQSRVFLPYRLATAWKCVNTFQATEQLIRGFAWLMDRFPENPETGILYKSLLNRVYSLHRADFDSTKSLAAGSFIPGHKGMYSKSISEPESLNEADYEILKGIYEPGSMAWFWIEYPTIQRLAKAYFNDRIVKVLESMV